MKRAKDVMEGVLNGRFEHSDLALYHLHINAQRQHKKVALKKQDLADVRGRLKIMFPSSKEPLPKLSLEALPPSLIEFINQPGVEDWKIEWMFQGDYFEQKTDGYKKKFHYNRHGMRDVYSKLIDTMGFSRWEIAYKMWLESLYRLDQAIRYEGQSFHVDTKKPVMQVAKMMSHVIDYDHLITVTIIQ